MKNKQTEFSKADDYVGKIIKGTKLNAPTEEFEGKVIQVNEAGIIIEYTHRKSILTKMIPFSSIVDFYFSKPKPENETTS